MAEGTNGDAVKTVGSHTLNGDPSAAAASDEEGDVTAGQVKETGTTSSAAADPDADGSAEAEDATTGGQGNAAMGTNNSSGPAKPGDLANAAAKGVTAGSAKGTGNGSSDPASPSAAIKPDGSSSPIASKAPAALARFTSLAVRVSDAVSNNLISPARAALTSLAVRVAGAVSNNPARAAFAALTLLALWRTAGDLRRVVWTFSAIAISYITLWTIWLTAAIPARTVLVSVSYIALVAISVTHLSSAAGIFVILLDTAYAAGLCGYALAEYRQRKGFELAADTLHARTKGESEDDRAAIVIAMAFFYSRAASALCAAAAAWVVYYYAADTYWVVIMLSLLIDFSLFYWMVLVAAHLLRCALLPDHYIALIHWCPVLLFVPDLALSCVFGNAIGVLVHPFGVMGMAGLLGYNLGLYDRYKQMLEGDNGKNKKLA
ncbi:unnamed protein product [Urochloa humidicola]